MLWSLAGRMNPNKRVSKSRKADSRDDKGNVGYRIIKRSSRSSQGRSRTVSPLLLTRSAGSRSGVDTTRSSDRASASVASQASPTSATTPPPATKRARADGYEWRISLVREYLLACGVPENGHFDPDLNHDWSQRDADGEAWTVNDLLIRFNHVDDDGTISERYVVAWGDSFSHHNYFSDCSHDELAGCANQLASLAIREAAVDAIKLLLNKRFIEPDHKQLMNKRMYGWVGESDSVVFSQLAAQAMEQITISKITEASFADAAPLFVVDLLRPPEHLTALTCRLPFGAARRTDATRYAASTSANNLRVKILAKSILSQSAVAALDAVKHVRAGTAWYCYCHHNTGKYPPLRNELVTVNGKLAYIDSKGVPQPPTKFSLKPKKGGSTRVVTECVEGECGCTPATCCNRLIQNGRRVALLLFYEGGAKQWGVRAGEDIPEHIFVNEYVGEVTTVADLVASRRDGSYAVDMLYSEECEQLTIDAGVCGNEARFFNHSCDPNLRIVPVCVERHGTFFHRVAFFTTRRIPMGEELTFKYREDDGTGPECHCRAPNCRGRI